MNIELNEHGNAWLLVFGYWLGNGEADHRCSEYSHPGPLSEDFPHKNGQVCGPTTGYLDFSQNQKGFGCIDAAVLLILSSKGLI